MQECPSHTPACFLGLILCVVPACAATKPPMKADVPNPECRGQAPDRPHGSALEEPDKTMADNAGVAPSVSDTCRAKALAAPEITPSEALKLPKKLSGRNPRYTSEARQAEITATILVRCILTKEGFLKTCKLDEPQTERERDLIQETKMREEITDALSTWRFEPATFAGQPCEIEYRHRFRWTLR